MSFFKTTVLFKLFYPIIILFLLTFSCSTDNSITGGSDQTNLSKPNEITDFFSGDDGSGYYQDFSNWLDLIPYKWYKGTRRIGGQALTAVKASCFFVYLIYDSEFPSNGDTNTDISKMYNFRDNYLSNSKKGTDYIFSYYLLSKYGIDNNLVMKHSLEHLSLMNTGIEVSRELQHGTNDNQILINRSTYNDLKDIMKIYRDSENHTDIDPVLNYLGTDLEKYYNKTKAEIAVDFE